MLGHTYQEWTGLCELQLMSQSQNINEQEQLDIVQ